MPVAKLAGGTYTAASVNVSQRSQAPAVGRNDPSPYGSGRKYTHCNEQRALTRVKRVWATLTHFSDYPTL